MSEPLSPAIDSLFAEWTLPGRPGAAVVVLAGGEVVHQGCYGRASLEFDAPIAPDTAFRIASITKQFTCAVLLLLADEGLVDLDAPVARYLPEMQDHAPPPTVRMLMRNVSGVRDSLECLRLCGGDIDVPHSFAETVAIVSRQPATNFLPGHSYLYSNANFVLLTAIAERSSGRSLEALIAERLTGPLGMRSTRMATSYAEVIPGMATGYLGARREDGTIGFTRGLMSMALSGEGGMISTADDLLLWLRNYRDDRLGVVERLATPHVFPNGTTSRYGHGLVVDRHRGLRSIGHGGLWPGYRSEIQYLPDLDIGVAILANNGLIDPYLMAGRILDIAGGDRFPEPVAAAVPDSLAAAVIDKGPWVNPGSGERITFARDYGGLSASVYLAPVPLADGGPGTMRVLNASFDIAGFRAVDGGVTAVDALVADGTTRRFVPAATLPPPVRPATDYAGRYVADGLAAIVIDERDGRLTARFDGRYVPGPAFAVEVVLDDRLSVQTQLGPWLGTNSLAVARDAAGTVTGFRLSGRRVRDVAYRRA